MPILNHVLDIEVFNNDMIVILNKRMSGLVAEGPAEFVAWMEQTYRMGINPIPAVKAMMAGLCDVESAPKRIRKSHCRPDWIPSLWQEEIWPGRRLAGVSFEASIS
jgi:hypothetical protein